LLRLLLPLDNLACKF